MSARGPLTIQTDDTQSPVWVVVSPIADDEGDLVLVEWGDGCEPEDIPVEDGAAMGDHGYGPGTYTLTAVAGLREASATVTVGAAS